MKWDGHTHTPFCPHGSHDSIESYIEKAIEQGFTTYSITEHAPLPRSFIDPVPLQDSAMRWEDLDAYLNLCKDVKKAYSSKINIKVGFEVDYLVGFERETKDFLQQVGPELDDAILSVHFLPIQDRWTCVDYGPEHFERDILSHFDSVDHLYRFYYEIYYKAVLSDLGPFKPKRMGHLSVIEKFKKKYPSNNKDVWWEQVCTLLQEIKRRNYQLDFNTAGLTKPLCLDVYPSSAIYQQARSLNIPFVFGSDAHQAKLVGHHYDTFIRSYS